MTFNEYGEIAHGFSKLHEFDNPDLELGKRAIAEMHEAFFEDGIGRAGLLLGLVKPDDTDHEVKSEIAKEFGDILWFINEDAIRNNSSIGQLAVESIARETGITMLEDPSIPITIFDKIVGFCGSNFLVTNHKMEAALPEDKKYSADVTIAETPGYVLQRVFARLSRVLNPTLFSDISGPPGNADFDSDELIENSRGNTLWVMSWIGQTMLDSSLEEIMQGNIAKLTRREEAGTILSGNDIDRSV